MPMPIEINSDVGEISTEIDNAILPFVSSCNVCCGAHAGDPELILSTVREAIRLGVGVGAHPSWPDRENFGRRSLDLPIDQLKSSIHQQIHFVKSLVEDNNGTLRHVKPHGALYHDVLINLEIASMLIDVVHEIDPKLTIYGQADSSFAKLCCDRNVAFVHEAFGDRRYESATELRARSNDDALLDDQQEFAQHVKQLISGSVIDIHGKQHSLNVQTICLHSDTPNAVTFAQLAHDLIQKRNNRTDPE